MRFCKFWLLCVLTGASTIKAQTPENFSNASSTAAITLGQAGVDSQGKASLDFTLISGDRPISALQFDIQYESRTIRLSESPGSTAIRAGKILWTSSPLADTIRIVIAGPSATPITDGIVATLSVQVPATAAPGFHPLLVTNVIASDSAGYFVSVPASNGGVTIPGPVILAVGNAASYASGAIAPGEIIVIWGVALSAAGTNSLQLTSNGLVASSLAGTSVLFDGIPAPLIYTTRNQLCAIVPYEVDGNSQTSLQVEFQGIPSSPVELAVTKSSPGIFTVNQSGRGQGAILNQDGTVNGPENPAPRGSIVSIYGTGEGQTVPPGVNGRILDGSDVLKPLLLVTGSIGEQGAEVVYAGSAGGQVSGFLQVNMRVPLTVARGGAVPLRITMGGSSQSGVTMAVQ